MNPKELSKEILELRVASYIKLTFFKRIAGPIFVPSVFLDPGEGPELKTRVYYNPRSRFLSIQIIIL